MSVGGGCVGVDGSCVDEVGVVWVWMVVVWMGWISVGVVRV